MSRRGKGFIKSDPILDFIWEMFVIPVLMLVGLFTFPCWLPIYVVLSYLHWKEQNK